MITAQTTIVNKLGLHARAATKFANTANRFSCRVELLHNAKSVDGKSIMSLMLLAAAKGAELEIRCDGDDQEEALQALLDLIADKFGEDC